MNCAIVSAVWSGEKADGNGGSGDGEAEKYDQKQCCLATSGFILFSLFEKKLKLKLKLLGVAQISKQSG